jgi:inorganic pyrophosphatase
LISNRFWFILKVNNFVGFGARGETRTRTPGKGRGILNPLCLPFHHPGMDMKKQLKTDDHSQDFVGFCQMENIIRIFLVSSFLTSCSYFDRWKTPEVTDSNPLAQTVSIAETKPIEVNNTITPKWYNIPLRFTLGEQDDKLAVHPFFDAQAYLPEQKQADLINYILTTPEDSSYKYSMDLFSGKIFRDRDYCAQKDIWDSYEGEIFKPNFSLGIIPQTYDQDQSPLQIMVYSSSPDRSFKFDPTPTKFATARILGSVTVEYCESYPCDSKEKWAPSQYIVGVNNDDPGFTSVQSINELKEKVDWNYSRAFLVNEGGVHSMGLKAYPAYRITKILNKDRTLIFLKDKAIKLNLAELTKWRETCFSLYDQIWTKAEEIRNGDSADKPDEFFQYFKEFYKTSSDDFYKCQKLIRPANINENSNRHWFFTFLLAVVNLEKNGFYYNCQEKSWAYNPKLDDQHFLNDHLKEMERCRAKYFEKMFDQAINGLGLVKNHHNKTFRYIEYDSGIGSTHQKLYSWTISPNRSYTCKQKTESRDNEFENFPHDVVWDAFPVNSSLDNKTIITDKTIIETKQTNK